MNKGSDLFAPHLYSKNVLAGMEFYNKAFNAVELRRFSNPDGSVHVAEMCIDGAIFHIHEEVSRKSQLSPESVHAVTSMIGIFVADPDTMVKNAIAAWGTLSSPMQDYDYGYRQGVVTDPFGHQWLLQKCRFPKKVAIYKERSRPFRALAMGSNSGAGRSPAQDDKVIPGLKGRDYAAVSLGVLNANISVF